MADEFNPPPGWTSEPPPTEASEDEVLRNLFGDPDEATGVYAPHIPGGEA